MKSLVTRASSVQTWAEPLLEYYRYSRVCSRNLRYMARESDCDVDEAMGPWCQPAGARASACSRIGLGDPGSGCVREYMRANAPALSRVRQWRSGRDVMTAVTAQRSACLGRPRPEPALVANVSAQYDSTSCCTCVHSRPPVMGVGRLRHRTDHSRLVRYDGQGVATGPCRALGMLATLQRALGLGDSSSTEALETHRADILAARSTQASAKLRRLLRREREKDAWEYFAQLCDGPDINEFHCSIMLSTAASPKEVQQVVDMAGRAGVQPNAAVYV